MEHRTKNEIINIIFFCHNLFEKKRYADRKSIYSALYNLFFSSQKEEMKTYN